MLDSIRHAWTLRGVIRDWIAFRECLQQKLGSPHVTPGEEEDFLTLKARIAAALPRLEAAVPDASAHEANRNFGQMKELLNRFRSLGSTAPLGELVQEEVDRIWHQQFIFLNALKGTAASRRRRAGTAAIPTGVPVHRRRRGGIPGAGLLRFAFRLGVFGVLVYVLGRGIGFHRDELGKVVFQPPTSFQGVMKNFVDGSRSVGGAVGQGLSPVVAAYGPEVTLVLVGVLILGISYLIFVKG